MNYLIMQLQRSGFLAVTAGITALLLTTGCGKKTVEPNTSTAPREAPAAAQPNNPATVPGGSGPAQAVAPDARLMESQAAINSQDYEKAAAALVAIRQSQLNAEQAEALAKQMRQLQGSLAAALASGDPRAKAAADKLRQSATVR